MDSETEIVSPPTLTGTTEEMCPLPDHPALAEVAVARRDPGLLGHGRGRDLAPGLRDRRLAVGAWTPGGTGAGPSRPHVFGPEWLSAAEQRNGSAAVEVARQYLTHLGPLMLADTPGGRKELRGLVDPRLRDVVDALRPSDRFVATPVAYDGFPTAGKRPRMVCTTVRVPDGTSPGPSSCSSPRRACPFSRQSPRWATCATSTAYRVSQRRLGGRQRSSSQISRSR